MFSEKKVMWGDCREIRMLNPEVGRWPAKMGRHVGKINPSQLCQLSEEAMDYGWPQLFAESEVTWRSKGFIGEELWGRGF